MSIRNDAAVRNNRLPQSGAVDFAAWQKARMRINRRFRVEETVFRHKVRKIEIRFIKSADRSDIFPVTFKNERAHMSIFDRVRNDVFAKIDQIIFQAFDQDVAIENINAHRGLE